MCASFANTGGARSLHAVDDEVERTHTAQAWFAPGHDGTAAAAAAAARPVSGAAMEKPALWSIHSRAAAAAAPSKLLIYSLR